MNNYFRRLECCQVMSIMTEQRSHSREVLLQTKWAESFLMLFVDAIIDERTQRILCHSRNNAAIYWGNGKYNQIKWFLCDEIPDFFYIFKIDKAEKSCCRPNELSPFSCYLLMPEFIKVMYFGSSQKQSINLLQ